MRRTYDRFCKLSFWPVVEYVGTTGKCSIEVCNFGSHDYMDAISISTPTTEVQDIRGWQHSVLDEPDFCSGWEAVLRAFLLESSLEIGLFGIEFDELGKGGAQFRTGALWMRPRTAALGKSWVFAIQLLFAGLQNALVHPTMAQTSEVEMTFVCFLGSYFNPVLT